MWEKQEWSRSELPEAEFNRMQRKQKVEFNDKQYYFFEKNLIEGEMKPTDYGYGMYYTKYTNGYKDTDYTDKRDELRSQAQEYKNNYDIFTETGIPPGHDKTTSNADSFNLIKDIEGVLQNFLQIVDVTTVECRPVFRDQAKNAKRVTV